MIDTDQPSRKRPIQREHFLQVAVKQFVRDAIDLPPDRYQFFALDSSQRATDNQRARQAARGVVTGTPDTLLCVAAMKPMFCELKWKAGKPSDDQNRLLQKLYDMGHGAAVANSVHNYMLHLRSWRVPLRSQAELIAADLDLKVAARIAKAEQRVATPGRAPKPAPRYSAGKRTTKRWAKAGLRV